MRKRFVFIDTNTFLHYPALNHIDWPVVLQCDFSILVIAPIVIRELNRHKDSPTSPKMRERARSARKRLHDWSEKVSPVMIRNSVELRFLAHEPLIDFAAARLSRDIADDHLLGTMIEFLGGNPGCDTVLVTEDLGLKLKAGAHGLSKVQLPPNIRLPDELGVEEKRIRQLEQDLKRIRERMPSLKLLFRSGEDRVHVLVRQPSALSKESIEVALTEVRNKQEKMEPLGGKTVADAVTALAIGLGAIPPAEVSDYNKRLEEYFLKYEQHLHAVQEFENLQRRTVRLDIIAVNEGTSPAEDVNIFMHFPNGFALVDEDHLPKRPSAPKTPARPKSQFEKLHEAMAAPMIPSGLLRGLSYKPPNLPEFRNASHPSIRRTKSYDVELEIGKIKHGFSEEIDSMYAIFPLFDDAASFTIEYRLHAANLPDLVEGHLHVIVDRS
jgi:PIN domain-containing protein